VVISATSYVSASSCPHCCPKGYVYVYICVCACGCVIACLAIPANSMCQRLFALIAVPKGMCMCMCVCMCVGVGVCVCACVRV